MSEKSKANGTCQLERVVSLPLSLAQDLLESGWSATSKLESQVTRNPDLPEGYKKIVKQSFEALKKLQNEVLAS